MVNIIPPKSQFETFIDDADYTEKLKEWGLSKKKQFLYKDGSDPYEVNIIGYEVYGKTTEHHTIVIEFSDGRQSCIHPAYLKEMQSPSFSKLGNPVSEKTTAAPKKSTAAAPKAKSEPKKAAVKAKQPKIELPIEKVHFTAVVKQFAKSWNHFNEENDEVVVLQDVTIEEETPIEVGTAWCSHSKTLKKFELTPGDKLEFDGKIIKKKLPAGKEVEEEFLVTEPVIYKINNPSKIKKS